ncbi:hypothetical protein T06_5805 [Trichinella sp. T6]|nr:hypothetical protein T06_5805 [Trichinella sp. T6]
MEVRGGEGRVFGKIGKPWKRDAFVAAAGNQVIC